MKTFGPKGDAYLANFYNSIGAKTTQQKLNVLSIRLGEDITQSHYYALGGNLTDEMKLGCLEYEFLEQAGQIELVLA